ncbi:hypothetical protein [Oceanibium sediminis]|uniref:hypothetical protein n=1 Tax=Oceanibium sediminis TaxID=2026339 RepID=UPI000DD4CBF9|nr:hypothetical protein [Oceanibium sediminis]
MGDTLNSLFLIPTDGGVLKVEILFKGNRQCDESLVECVRKLFYRQYRTALRWGRLMSYLTGSGGWGEGQAVWGDLPQVLLPTAGSLGPDFARDAAGRFPPGLER